MVQELLRAHASVRKYKDYSLSREEVSELVKTAQHAASSHFVQAYSVIWVTDVEKKKNLADFLETLSNSRQQEQLYYFARIFIVYK